MGDQKRHDGVGRKIDVEEVFFDFEGTLVDFQWKLEPAVEECLSALEAVGFKRQWFGPTPSYASIYNDTYTFSLEGRGQGDPQVNMAIIDSIYDKYDADALTRWRLYPETTEMLAALDGMGFQMGLISNIGKKSLHAAMDRLNLLNRITVVLSRDDVERLKPDPAGLLKAASELKVTPARVVFIGDSRKDVDAARRAGMLAGFITGGEEAPQTIHENPADIQINRLSELPPRLRRRASETTGWGENPMQADEWKIYLDRIPHNETGTFWVSFESDSRLTRNKANIYGRCLPCIQNLYDQLGAGKTAIAMGTAYHCWKITAVLENLDQCMDLLTEFEKRFPGGHVYGKLGSGRTGTTTKVVVFHADDKTERDRLNAALEQCVRSMALDIEILISRGCAVLYEPILGEWRLWKATTSVRYPERVPAHIQRLKRIMATGKM